MTGNIEIISEPQVHRAGGGAAPKVRFAEIEAEIIRADGTRVPLGLIAGRARNPFLAAWMRIRRYFADRRIRAANRSIQP